MTTSSNCDVTFFLASDGREWGDYCKSVLGSFPEIAYTLLEVNKYDPNKLPDVTSACCQSPVWVLLATSQLLRCLRDTWLSSLLSPPPAASTVVVVTIDDEQNVHDVFSNRDVTSRWTVLDCGQREDELRKMMAALLNIIETSQRPEGKADVAVQLYPENIREPGTSIAIVFSQEVTHEVKVVVGSSQECPVSRFNSCVLTFKAPAMSPGTYDVSVMAGGLTLHCALTYLPLDRHAFECCHFLRQWVALTDQRTLDRYLAHALMLGQDHVTDIFLGRRGFYSAPGKLFPTSIHFAAANGLSEFCSALMNIAGSREASRELNCKKSDAASLALENDFKQLAANIKKTGEVVDMVNSGYIFFRPPVQDAPPPPPCLPRAARWSSDDPATLVGDSRGCPLPPRPRFSSDNTTRHVYTRPQFGSVPDMSVLPALDPNTRPPGGYRNHPAGVMMATSPADVTRQRLYLPKRRTDFKRSKTTSVEEDLYENPLCGPVTNRPRAPLLKGFSQDSAHTSHESNTRVIEGTGDTCISQGSRDSGVSARDNKSPRTPPQDLTRVTEGRDSGFSQGSRDSGVNEGSRDSGVSQGSRDSGVSQGSRDSGVSQGPRDSGVSTRDIKTPGSKPQDLIHDSGVSQGARDNLLLVSNREKSLTTEKRMSYADKFLQRAPIPPPRRRKKKVVETTKL